MPEEKAPKGFKKAQKTAKNLLDNSKKIKELLDKGLKKSKSESKRIGSIYNELQALFRLVKCYFSGDYRQIKSATLIYAIAAIVYFVNPFDVVPDFILGFGFMDDATVVAFVISKLKKELDAFKFWENNRVEEEASS